MIAPRPIEIVGGGLAGLALGLALQRRGVPVTLFEAGNYPRHRVCGEFISGIDAGSVARLGLGEILADARPHRRMTYHLGSRALRPFTLPETAWGISRYTLDARVAAAFVAAGGRLLTRTRAPEQPVKPGRVFSIGRNRSGPLWVGLKIHLRGLALAGDCEIHLGDHAYLGLSRTETGAVNLCGIFAPREISARGAALIPGYLRATGLGDLAERLAEAEPDESSFCVVAASLGDRCTRDDGLLRVGDACATIPPFTGNGLAMALQSAEIAVEPLCAYADGRADWEETRRGTARAQQRRFGRRLALAAWLHPFFLTPRRQAWLAALVNFRLVPFGAFYAGLH